MKKIIFTLLICWMTGRLQAGDAPWLTSVPEALAQAKKENKLVLLDFTGSDWCLPCQKLAKNVFSTSEFAGYAQTNLVLVELDFPLAKKQSPELIAANSALQEKYHVDGQPTVILLKPDGAALWTHAGYEGQSPAQFIAMLDAAKQKK
jgi:protein disulfide-isomerase